jgi:hypothetical protein
MRPAFSQFIDDAAAQRHIYPPPPARAYVAVFAL